MSLIPSRLWFILIVSVLASGCGGSPEQQTSESHDGSQKNSDGPATNDAAEEEAKDGVKEKTPKAVMTWDEARKLVPADIPLPVGGIITLHENFGERSRMEIQVVGKTIADLMPLYDAMKDDGWIPLANNSNGRKNDKLAQYTNNKGPTQVGVNLLAEDPSVANTMVMISIGKDPRYRPDAAK